MVEKTGEVDGSSAWVAAFGSANTYIAALPDDAQAVIYADGPDQVYAGASTRCRRLSALRGLKDPRALEIRLRLHGSGLDRCRHHRRRRGNTGRRRGPARGPDAGIVPTAKVSTLSVDARQKVETLKALWGGARAGALPPCCTVCMRRERPSC